MKGFNFSKKRTVRFKKTKMNIETTKDLSDFTYSVITDQSVVLFTTETARKYDLDVLGIYSQDDEVTISLNGTKSEFLAFVADLCKYYGHKIEEVRF